jgi:hypothetical protein
MSERTEDVAATQCRCAKCSAEAGVLGDLCDMCEGEGCEIETACPQCQGFGWVIVPLLPGFAPEKCKHCNGKGVVIDE